ncbi:hypothetical protein D3C72_1523040 [compost metagenome]
MHLHFLGLEHQHIALKCIEYHLGGVPDQRPGNPGAGHGANHRHHRIIFAGGVRDQYICRAFGHMQAFILDIEFGLECAAFFAVTLFDGFLQLIDRIGCRQHR